MATADSTGKDAIFDPYAPSAPLTTKPSYWIPLSPFNDMYDRFSQWRADLGLPHPGTVENLQKEVKSEYSCAPVVGQVTEHLRRYSFVQFHLRRCPGGLDEEFVNEPSVPSDTLFCFGLSNSSFIIQLWGHICQPKRTVQRVRAMASVLTFLSDLPARWSRPRRECQCTLQPRLECSECYEVPGSSTCSQQFRRKTRLNPRRPV